MIVPAGVLTRSRMPAKARPLSSRAVSDAASQRYCHHVVRDALCFVGEITIGSGAAALRRVAVVSSSEAAISSVLCAGASPASSDRLAASALSCAPAPAGPSHGAVGGTSADDEPAGE